jgi:hypothetical protein
MKTATSAPSGFVVDPETLWAATSLGGDAELFPARTHSGSVHTVSAGASGGDHEDPTLVSWISGATVAGWSA